MRILLIADGRSPITKGWLSGLMEMGHSITLISSFPCDIPLQPIKMVVIPVAFGKLAGQSQATTLRFSAGASQRSKALRRMIGRFRPTFLSGRYWLGPASLFMSGDIKRFREVVNESHPDLVHALRIPFEGMLGSFLPASMPLVVSIWGNDLTLHAQGSPWMGSLTRGSLHRANGLMADTNRDLRLAQSWGYREDGPTLCVPGSGGIDLEKIEHCFEEVLPAIAGSIPEHTPLVVNPRGFRPGSLRMDTFFASIPLVLERVPEAMFLCPAMAGQEEANRWVMKLGIESQVRLLPTLPQEQLWSIFHQAQVYVSPSVHDGTPNSFLEALACGCFPVVGGIESFGEWLQHGKNGLLVDATDPAALANGILQALEFPDLRHQAAITNQHLIADRAEVSRVRPKIAAFYEQVLKSGEHLK